MLIPQPYAFDPTGQLAANKILDEQHIVTHRNHQDFHFLVPKFAPFFETSIVVKYQETGTRTPITLTKGKDYFLTHFFKEGSLACAFPIYGSVTLLRRDMQGVITFSYQTVGGDWLIDENTIQKILADRIHNTRRTYWDQIAELPYRFPVINHDWNIRDLDGSRSLTQAILSIADAMYKYRNAQYEKHIQNKDNPHGITKNTIGLENVLNLPILQEDNWEDNSNDFYITPKGLNKVLTEKVLDTLNGQNSLIEDLRNRLQTLSQAGTSVEVIEQLKVYFNNNPIGNTERFNNLTYDDLLNDIRGLDNLNAATLNGKTYENLVSEIRGSNTGVGNANSLEGYSFNDIMGKVDEKIDSIVIDTNATRLNGLSAQQIIESAKQTTVRDSEQFSGLSLQNHFDYIKKKLSDYYTYQEHYTGKMDSDIEKAGYLIPIAKQYIAKSKTSVTPVENIEYHVYGITGFSTATKALHLSGRNDNTGNQDNYTGFTEVNIDNIPEVYRNNLSRISLDSQIAIGKLQSINDTPTIKLLNELVYTQDHSFDSKQLFGFTTGGGFYYRKKDNTQDTGPGGEVLIEEITYYFYQRSYYRPGTIRQISRQSGMLLGSKEEIIDLSDPSTPISLFTKVDVENVTPDEYSTISLPTQSLQRQLLNISNWVSDISNRQEKQQIAMGTISQKAMEFLNEADGISATLKKVGNGKSHVLTITGTTLNISDTNASVYVISEMNRIDGIRGGMDRDNRSFKILTSYKSIKNIATQDDIIVFCRNSSGGIDRIENGQLLSHIHEDLIMPFQCDLIQNTLYIHVY